MPPGSLTAYYNFAPVAGPGTPELVAKDGNGNIVLSLSTSPDANGSYCKLGSGTFTASDGTVVPQGYWLEAFLSAITTGMFKGQVLYWQLDFTPAGTFSAIRFIAADSKFMFSGDNSTGCVSDGTLSPSDTFTNDLLTAGYSEPIEDDWLGSLAPPASPVLGIRYVVPAQATGLWAGKDGQVAEWTNAGWVFAMYTNGVTAYIRNRYIRSQLVDFNHAAPTVNSKVVPSDTSTTAWVEDHQLDSMVNPYIGIVTGVANTPPVAPTPYAKYLIGAAPVWPDTWGVVVPNMIAMAVVDQLENTIHWVYRKAAPGELFYRSDDSTFYYYDDLLVPQRLIPIDVDNPVSMDDWLGPYLPPTYPQYATLIGPQHADGAMYGWDGRARLSNGDGTYTDNVIFDNGDPCYIINRLYAARLQDYSQLLAQPQNPSQGPAYPLFPSETSASGSSMLVWTPDWLNDANRSMVIEKIQGTSTTLPVAPEVWQKWIVGAGGDAFWPNNAGVVGSLVGCIATYVISSSDILGYWIYRQPAEGDFTYDLSLNKFYYYDVSGSWVELQTVGPLNGHTDTNLASGPAADQYVVTWDDATGKYILAPSGAGVPGPPGATGATGPAGPPGPAGTDGTGVFFGASVLLPATTEFENPAGVVTTGGGSFNFLIPAGYTKARFWVQFAPSATTTKKAWGIRWTTTAPGGGGAYTDQANSGFGALGEFTAAPALTYVAPADPGTGTGVGVKDTDYSEILVVVPGRHYEIVGLAGPTQYRHGIELWQ